MKKKIIFASVLLASATLALASCKNDVDVTSTPSVTTSAPTTSAPSTSTPTSSVPTTVAPTTVVPTTVAPTTVAPTTVAPTTTTPVEQQNPIEMNGVAYNTIKDAFAAIPTSGDTSTYTIRLQKGTYKEVGLSYNGSATIRIIGNTDAKYGSDVIIEGRGSNMTAMRARELMEIQGTGNIILENLSLVSDYSRSEGGAQAEVLGTDTKGNTVAYNCSFKSHQDTVRTAGKAWFYGCYVEGDTDFIWMEAAGSVALYENCEIVSVYDQYANTHVSYVAAPRMTISSKVGKGLVFFNSTVRESDEAKANNQQTYLARTPWTSGYYNQVAYINTNCSDIEANPWSGNMIPTDYAQTIIGWKIDGATAESLGLSNKDYILGTDVTNSEYNGRRSILNRIYNTGKQKYEKDATNYWDIDALIVELGYAVDEDNSKAVLDGEVETTPVVYTFDGTTDYSSICSGFAQENNKPHYVGQNGSTITIPVTGKCYVEVYGYYAGTVETKADTQGSAIMFFNNGSTNTQIEQDYIVYDATAKEVVITAKATTYITKVVVTPDSTIPASTPVSQIAISASSNVQSVGVAITLSASVNKDATNKSVIWSSSDESIATIDPYTGKVTFKSAGNVTFTATSTDGSNVTATYECNPTEATWTVAEWYTTDNKNIAAEDGAQGIENFGVNQSEYKDCKATYTFTNLEGKTISSGYGLKLNGKGMLSIATTKSATLTLITCQAGTLGFVAPKVSLEDGTLAVLKSSVTAEDGKTATYVYELTGAGMWNIVRNASKETNPILYAKCEYDAVWDFKNATPSSITSVNIQGTSADVESNVGGVKITVDATCASGKLQYNASGYAQFNSGTIIRVYVKNVGSVITTESYPGQSKWTIGSGENMVKASPDTDIDTYTVTAEDVERGYVEIISTGGAYIYSITLSNPR